MSSTKKPFKIINKLLDWVYNIYSFLTIAVIVIAIVAALLFFLLGRWDYLISREDCEQLVINKIHFKGMLLAKKEGYPTTHFIVIDSFGTPKQLPLPGASWKLWVKAQKGDLIIKEAWSDEIILVQEGQREAFPYPNTPGHFSYQLYEYGFFDLADTAYYFCLVNDKAKSSRDMKLYDIDY
ncbi:hypothetical protein [Saprospira grandis]|uniref:hypothetical protein n=1 Tax=Saprospira grandis TaxID=1008 RepID=UPI0022DE946A|nr:hypothetical protein [Saprospira grandis]WBM73390.1 hypothetical protein OP864_10310 [Saprospira grandis]